MPAGPPLLYLDRTSDVSGKERHGIVYELTRKCDVHGLTSTDYGVIQEALTRAGLPVAGMPLVTPNLRRLHPYGMLVLTERNVKVMEDDNSKATVTLEYRHFMEHDNQDISQMSMNIPTFRPTLPIGGAAGPPGAYIGWFSVFGKNKTAVQQSKTNFGYRPRPQNVIPTWRLQVVIVDWNPASDYPPGTLVRFNDVIYFTLHAIGVNNPPPPNPRANWRIARPGVDFVPVEYAAGTVVQWNNIYWISTEAVTYGVPGQSSSWRIAFAGADYPIVEDSRERYLITLGHKFPADDPDYGGQVKYQTGEITIMDPNRHYEVQGQVFTAFPWRIANDLIGRINKFPWMDGDTDEWMCTEVAWTAIFVRRKYLFKFEFQHNPDGWQPTAVFLDRRTGKPPPALVRNFGYQTVAYHKQLDFNFYFQSNFEL